MVRSPLLKRNRMKHLELNMKDYSWAEGRLTQRMLPKGKQVPFDREKFYLLC
jgi:hypothetical protein